VKDLDTGCVRTDSLEIKTNPKVPAEPEEPKITECDGDDADGKTYFDLTAVSGLISGTDDTNYIYYETLADAQANTNAISDPGHWKNPTPYNHRVYVRVQRADHCDNLASIQTVVYPYIKVQDQPDVTVCEFESDGKTPSRVDLWEEVKFMHSEVNSLPEYPNLLDDLDITFYTSDTLQIPSTELSAYLVPVGKTKLKVRFQSKTTKCYQIRELTITKTPAPKLNQVSHLLCDDNLDEVYDLVLSTLDTDIPSTAGNYEISYHESALEAETAGGTAINKDSLYTIPYADFPKTLHIRVKDLDTGCVRTDSLEIKTNPKVTVSPEVELTACDGDNNGFAEFDLTLVQNAISTESDITYTYFLSLDDAQKNQNPITAITAYTNLVSNLDSVYVRVEENPGLNTRCPSLSRIKLQTYYPPNPLPKAVSICPRTKTILDAGDFDEYLWSTGETTKEITVGEAGIYTVTVTKYLNYGLSCSATFQVEVNLLEEPVITDLQEGDDYITVIAKGPLPLEYSIDNKHWQRSNMFTDLGAGIYTFYVRSLANGCEGIPSKGIIFKIPNVITPNGDGYNDTWRLCGLDLFDTTSHIKIFDRYGKQVFEQDSRSCFIWDGKYLGRNLPTTSYWYIITIADGRQFTGWILLRNYDEDYR
jgi:gliding motility-associated-like protein